MLITSLFDLFCRNDYDLGIKKYHPQKNNNNSHINPLRMQAHKIGDKLNLTYHPKL